MCNCEGNKYNINFGCCVPVVANADNYYTKSEIDEKIDEIVISGGGITSGEVQTMIDESIADKANKSEIPTVPTKVSAFENDVPYLTQHQSLSGYATEQWVLDKHYISGVDLSDYATKEYVSGFTYDKATIDEKVAGGGTFDPTQYYNKTQTNQLLSEKADTATTYSKVEVNSLLSNKADTTALNDYYNKSQTDVLLGEKLDASAYTPTDLSNYDTKSEVNTKISNATSIVNGALTAHTANTTVHVTQAEKNTWNSKQDVLSAGSGIDISNNVISATGGGTNYNASSGISITNDEISTKIGGGLRYAQDGTLEVNSTNAIASGNTQVPLSYVVHNYINNNCVLKSKIWCGTQSQYDSITTKDSETIYLIHE